jgi:hypothetical protein
MAALLCCSGANYGASGISVDLKMKVQGAARLTPWGCGNQQGELEVARSGTVSGGDSGGAKQAAEELSMEGKKREGTISEAAENFILARF